jgi:predicted Zn-dependent peptidase
MGIEQEVSLFELSNGIRVVHKHTDRPVSHVGLMINAGSRDEIEGEEGIAHFIEHAIFKGTKNRRSYHILNRMDSVGGDLDAYTTKEITCFYASFLNEHYDRALELISDISLNASFPEKELEKEKEVVLDEIKVYLDSPADQIYDDFEDQVFDGHALGHGILGNEKSVRSFKREQLLEFTSRLYRAEEMVISSVGKISVKRLKSRLEKYFSAFPSGPSATSNRTAFENHQPVKKIHLPRANYQTHCVMGKSVYGARHPKRLTMILLNNLLGGPAMNTMLNLNVREKYGFSYNIESHYVSYSDTGLFSIYLGTDPKYIDRCLKAVHRELKKLRERKLSPTKLNGYKQQLKGQLALSRENNASLMLYYAKNLLIQREIKAVGDILKAIDEISAQDLLETANQHLNERDFHYLFFDGQN